MTITLAAVFAPLAFLTGRTGRLFTEFALSVAGAVLVSGFVALTLSPMMCSKMLRHQAKHTALYRVIERGIGAADQRLSAGAGGRPSSARGWWSWVPAIAGSSYFLFTPLKSELAPVEDRGVFMGIGLAPEGSTLDFTDRYAQRSRRCSRRCRRSSSISSSPASRWSAR